MSGAASVGVAHRDIVAFLSRPAAYGVCAVEARETHMSWVFLTSDRVFKLKKPIKMSLLDYSTIAARERFCREEVRLNRRLAPSVYLGVRPIAMAEGGALSIGGRGKVIDWLVEMRRLPEERMLDHVLLQGAAPMQEFDKALQLLYAFFAAASPAAVSSGEYLATLHMQHRENRAVLADERFGLARNGALHIVDALQETIDAAPAWLLAPVESGRIIEGHGDLRPEHVCLTDPPVIIDCLEFNRDLRLVDPFDELSYLALECRLLGAVALADSIVDRYAIFIGARPPQILLDFYTAYRAVIRARLALGHIFDWPRGDPRQWTAKARDYLAAACAAFIKARPQGIR